MRVRINTNSMAIYSILSTLMRIESIVIDYKSGCIANEMISLLKKLNQNSEIFIKMKFEEQSFVIVGATRPNSMGLSCVKHLLSIGVKVNKRVNQQIFPFKKVFFSQ